MQLRCCLSPCSSYHRFKLVLFRKATVPSSLRTLQELIWLKGLLSTKRCRASDDPSCFSWLLGNQREKGDGKNRCLLPVGKHVSSIHTVYDYSRYLGFGMIEKERNGVRLGVCSSVLFEVGLVGSLLVVSLFCVSHSILSSSNLALVFEYRVYHIFSLPLHL